MMEVREQFWPRESRWLPKREKVTCKSEWKLKLFFNRESSHRPSPQSFIRRIISSKKKDREAILINTSESE